MEVWFMRSMSAISCTAKVNKNDCLEMLTKVGHYTKLQTKKKRYIMKCEALENIWKTGRSVLEEEEVDREIILNG